MSTIQTEIYSKGDWIVHANYGVGQVKGKDKKILEGEKKTFLKIKTRSAEYWLPIKKASTNHVRPLASKYQVRRALSLIRKPPKELSKDYRTRKKQIVEALNDVNLYAKARMIRDLNAKLQASKLNFHEKLALEKMEKQLLNEWVIINGKTHDELETKLRKALHTGLEKIKGKSK